MAVADIAVANLATNEPPVDPVKAIEPENPFYEPEDTSVAPPLYKDMKPGDDPAAPRVVEQPKKEEVKAEPEVKKVEEKAPEVKVEPIKHSVESISKASSLGIPAAEIDAMTPAELSRTVKYMEGIAQAAYDAGRKQSEPSKKSDEKSAVVEYDLDKNENGYTPEIIQAMRDSREAKLLREEMKQLKEEVQASKMERVHLRLDGHFSKLGDAAKEFDRTTAKGESNFKEALFMMKGLQDAGRAAGKDYSEEQLVQMAARAMGIQGAVAAKKDGSEQDAKIEEALKERQKEQDAGALARPESRSKTPSVLETVRDKIKSFGLKVDQPAEETAEVEWLPSPK